MSSKFFFCLLALILFVECAKIYENDLHQLYQEAGIEHDNEKLSNSPQHNDGEFSQSQVDQNGQLMKNTQQSSTCYIFNLTIENKSTISKLRSHLDSPHKDHPPHPRHPHKDKDKNRDKYPYDNNPNYYGRRNFSILNDFHHYIWLLVALLLLMK